MKRALIEARAAVILSSEDASEADKLEARRRHQRPRRPGGRERCCRGCRPARADVGVLRRHADAVAAMQSQLAAWNTRAERLVRALARLGAAARRDRARHHLRRDGRHQHGARRDGDDRRLRRPSSCRNHPHQQSGAVRLFAADRACRSLSSWPAFIGILIERTVIRFLYGRPLETLLATWGLSLILQQAVRTAFGPTNREVGTPSWMSGAFEIGQITITYNRLWIICFTLAVFVALLGAAALHAARPGDARGDAEPHRWRPRWASAPRAIDALDLRARLRHRRHRGRRAVADRQRQPQPRPGLHHRHASWSSVFGGVGNLWGTLVGAFTLGIANKFLEPFAGAVLGKIAILVLIILFIQKRPRGLFALKGRAVEA